MTPAAPAAVLAAPRVGLLASFLDGVRTGMAKTREKASTAKALASAAEREQWNEQRQLEKARAHEKAREQKNWLTTKPVSTTTDKILISPTDTRRTGEYREEAPCHPRP